MASMDLGALAGVLAACSAGMAVIGRDDMRAGQLP
jgi:beta-phosphoglucomutase-like phosphatase (HAD superfamily)